MPLGPALSLSANTRGWRIRFGRRCRDAEWLAFDPSGGEGWSGWEVTSGSSAWPAWSISTAPPDIAAWLGYLPSWVTALGCIWFELWRTVEVAKLLPLIRTVKYGIRSALMVRCAQAESCEDRAMGVTITVS